MYCINGLRGCALFLEVFMKQLIYLLKSTLGDTRLKSFDVKIGRNNNLICEQQLTSLFFH
jgi:hypothetical protein